MTTNDQIQVRSVCQECDGQSGWMRQDPQNNEFYWQPCPAQVVDGKLACKEGYIYRWVDAAEYLRQLLNEESQAVR